MKNTKPRVEIDHDLFGAKVNNQTVNLSSREFEIFDLLMRNRGKVCTRKFIEQKLDGRGDNPSRLVDVYIGYLRKKLGWEIIKTRRQYGYYIEK